MHAPCVPARAEALAFGPGRIGAGTREHLQKHSNAGYAAHAEDVEFFLRPEKGAPASIMSISGVAISGRGAPNPARQAQRSCGTFMPLGEGPEGLQGEERANDACRRRLVRLFSGSCSLSGAAPARPRLHASASSGRCPPLGAAP